VVLGEFGLLLSWQIAQIAAHQKYIAAGDASKNEGIKK
jgi:hypothetical protein